METSVRVTVAIDYFKTTGKWYSEGSFEMDLESIPSSWLVRERVKEMRRDGTRPGLVDNSNCEFVWVVRVRYEGEEHAQFLFLPEPRWHSPRFEPLSTGAVVAAQESYSKTLQVEERYLADLIKERDHLVEHTRSLQSAMNDMIMARREERKKNGL